MSQQVASHFLALLMGAGGEPDRSAEIEYVAHTIEGVKSDGKGENIAQARLLFNSLGTASEISDVGSATPSVGAGEWHRDEAGAGLGDAWEVRATVTSGTDPTIGNVTDWQRLDVIVFWDNLRSDDTHGVGVTTTTITLEWRLFGFTTIQKTVTGTILRAEIAA